MMATSATDLFEQSGKKGTKMLVIRFTHSFRERLPEWVTSAIMLLWGLSVFSDPELFQSTNYIFLGSMLPPLVWGGCAIIGGVVRLISLYINGRKRQTPAARMAGACMGMFIWYGLWVGGLSAGAIFVGVAYLGLAVLDTAALYFATMDAKKVTKGGGSYGSYSCK